MSPNTERQWARSSERGTCILAKLRAHAPERLATVLDDIYRNGTPDPMDITKFEWETILRYCGATDEEIADVQLRMGRVWR